MFRSAHALGIATVAVFSDADQDAPFVGEADQAVRIGEGPAGRSYLSIDAILAAAAETFADAVHPGYGFLAENAEFARRCADAGLTFVGPPVHAIAAMGDKVLARRRMVEAGVPVVPGYEGEDDSDAELAVAAERLGVPLLVKAVAGGGGRGMRTVASLGELPTALASARSEAQAAFGNGALFLERKLLGGRHIEIQVIADQHGNVAHLGERECSVQRRHQKVIEEAPSPAVDAELRARMGAAAVAAARAIDYVGAGTVEFLLTDGGEFFFLEMNTRLQVEHPVTELVTGHDLVELQLRAAAGERLALTGVMAGHAIEARIYAEDPYAGYVPQIGPIAVWRPASGEGVRVDDGVQTGQTITPFYDAMIAKVIAWGPDRETARRRLIRAVRRSVLLGPTTNRSFLAALLSDPMFIAGDVRTDTLDGRGAPGEAPQPDAPLWALAAVLRSGAGTWNSRGEARWSVTLRCGELEHAIALAWEGGRSLRATIGDRAMDVEVLRREGHDVLAEVDGVRRRYTVADQGPDAVAIDDDGHAFRFSEPSALGARADAVGGDDVRTPMGGRVVQVLVVAGDAVTRGHGVAIVEAMKMEHRVAAPRDGTIATVRVAPEDQVDAGQILATLERDDE